MSACSGPDCGHSSHQYDRYEPDLPKPKSKHTRKRSFRKKKGKR